MTTASDFLTDAHSQQQHYPEGSNLYVQSSRSHVLRSQPAYSQLQLLSLSESSELQYQSHYSERTFSDHPSYGSELHGWILPEVLDSHQRFLSE